MGSGKSTVGELLASELGYEFIDTDKLIIEQENSSIKEIFEKKGEPYFRKLETKFLKKISLRKNIVISTGGGMPCFNENLEIMQKVGLTFYLRLSLTKILKRIKSDKKRPLIMNKSEKEIGKLLSQRKQIYIKADKCLVADRKPIMIVNRIKKIISIV